MLKLYERKREKEKASKVRHPPPQKLKKEVKKDVAKKYECFWTLKRPLNTIVKSTLPNFWPIEMVTTAYAQNSCSWFLFFITK